MAEAAKPSIYDYETPAEVEYKYATNVVVSHSNREFFISFVCARPYEKPLGVARVIVGPEHLKEIIGVMKLQLDKFIEARSSELDRGGDLPRI